MGDYVVTGHKKNKKELELGHGTTDWRYRTAMK